MKNLLNEIDLCLKEKSSQENLFVNKIIVNKDKEFKNQIPYIPTEKWIKQLGNRLQANF